MLKQLSALFDQTYSRFLSPIWIVKRWDEIDRSNVSDGPYLARLDFLLAFALGVCGLLVSNWGYGATEQISGIFNYLNIYLEADIPRNFENMTSIGGTHNRTDIHPITSILFYPIVSILSLLGLSQYAACKLLVVLASGLSVFFFFLTLRLSNAPRFLGSLFSTLFIASAGYIYWTSILDLYVFSLLGITLSMFLMMRRNGSSILTWTCVGVFTLGITTPNWIFALIAGATRLKFRTFFLISILSFTSVLVLNLIQFWIFSDARLFFTPRGVGAEVLYLQPVAAVGAETSWSPLNNLRVLLTQPIVAMPTIIAVHYGQDLVTSNQWTGFPPGEWAPIIALISWVVLFGLGFWGAINRFRQKISLPILGVCVMLLSQTILFSVYGEITFMYSLHVVPLMLFVSACSRFTNFKLLSIGLASLLLICGAHNNANRFVETVAQANCLGQTDWVKNRQIWSELSVPSGTPIAENRANAVFPEILPCTEIEG